MMPPATDTHTKNNDTTKNETTKGTPTKTVIPNDRTSTKEPELIYAVPSSKLKITITLYPHRPLSYASLRCCLKGAHRRAKPPQNRTLPTPNRYLYYPPSNHNNNTPTPKAPLQMGIAGDLLWGRNQLLWGDVASILGALLQWTKGREADGEAGVEFSFSVAEEGREGMGGRGEIATGHVRRWAEYLDHGAYGREREVWYDAFRLLFGIRRV
ncbi:MAG: hypothetical protein LQ339_007417 [Xanthoria mediterranea]|nr:MAG: hypothetical protein LQ339_007417 [Xanthoria mediterranea]